MSESQGESTSIDLSVDADQALQVFEQLSAAARDTDEQIQQLKQHLTQQVATTFGAQGLRPQTYEQATGFLSRMDPAEVAQAAPDIAQTKTALAARSTDIQAQAMAYAGSTPGLASQPPADVLAQFQQAMAQREQQQQAQRERQAQQQAAGVAPPARYGSEMAPVLAPPAATAGPAPQTPPTGSAPMSPTNAPPSQPTPTGAPVSVPLATTGDDRLAQALSAQTPTPTPLTDTATGVRDNDDAPMGDVLPPESGRSNPPPVTVQSVAPLATTGDERLVHALSVQTPTATPPTGRAAATGGDAPMGDLPGDLQALGTAAIAADTSIQRLQQHLVEAINAEMGAAGIRPQNYAQAADYLQRMPAAARADLAVAAPDVVVTEQRIAARSAEVTGQVAAFGSQTSPGATSGQPIGDLLNELKAFVQQRQQASTAGGGSTAPNGGAGSGADTSAVARYGLPTTTPPALTPGGDTTQTDRFAGTLGEKLTSSMARAGIGMVTGGIQGAASSAGMGATGDVLAGLARPLLAMVSAPLAIGAAVIGGVAGVGLGINSLQSRYAGEERQLAGSVATASGATPEGELTTAQQTGWRYYYHEQQSVAAAQQLGDVGVTSDQMGGALTQSMALARVSGVGLDQTTALTGQMMQGGMSSNQVGQAYAELDQVSRLVPVSLGRLTEGIKAMNQAAGVGQISLNGLAATQALSDQTGMKINIGQAMAGTIGSTGTSALAQGYMLGLDPAQFDAAQRDPAKLWDAYANTARRYDVGPGGERIAQQALSEAGFDFSGMKGNQADTFIKKLVAEGPNAAQTYEASLQKKENAPGAAGPHTADQFAAAGKAFADQVTPVGEQLKINLEAGAAAIVRATGQIAAAPSGHDNVVHAQTTYQAAQQLANAQRMHQSPAVIAARERALLQADPNATGTSLSGAPAILNPGAENPALRQPFPPGVGDPFAGDMGAQSIRVQTTHGPAYLKPNIVHGAEAASRKTGVPLAILLAQAAQESGGDPHAVSPDGGYGAYQFTDDASARKYLHVAPGQDWHGAAYDPKRSAEGAAEMDADLYKRAGGNWQKALAMNNAGNNGWNYTGHPGQGRDYGTAVYGSAQDVEHRLEVVVHVKDGTTGKTVGHTHTTHTVRTPAAHSVDTSRKHVGAQSYGPDQRPPSPGLPNLTGHIGGPLRR